MHFDIKCQVKGQTDFENLALWLNNVKRIPTQKRVKKQKFLIPMLIVPKMHIGHETSITIKYNAMYCVK